MGTLRGDEGDGGSEGFECEVGDDAEPGEEGGLGGVEVGGEKLGGEGLAFKVDGNEGKAGGRGQIGLVEEVALPGLCGWVVDLKTRRCGWGLRRAKVSRPAPRITYWVAPFSTACASFSSA